MNSWQLAHLSANVIAGDYSTIIKPETAHWLTRVIIPMDNGIVSVQKSDTDYWHLTGGKVQNGETIPDCAVREVQEETNLTVKCERLLYVRESYVDASVEFFILASYQSGELSLGTQSDDLADITVLSYDDLEHDDNLIFYPSAIRKRLRRDLQHPPSKALYLGQID